MEREGERPPHHVDLREACMSIPKAELHLHIEGTLEPEMEMEMGRRNGVHLPYASAREASAAREHFAGLGSFLELYYQGSRVLQKEQDFYELTRAYLQRARAQGVVHAEVFVDPQAHLERGIALSTLFEGIKRAVDEEVHVSCFLIVCFLREKSAEEAMKLLNDLVPYIEQGLVQGVGIDSAEVGNPPGKFKDVFARARELNLHCVAHAGEEGSAEYVWEALKELQVERIDHGALKTLPSWRIFAHVAYLSQYARSPTFVSKVTINSDDPAYFGGYIGDNYVAVAESLSLTLEQIYALARNSLEASFFRTEAERTRHMALLEAWRRQFLPSSPLPARPPS